MVFRIHGFGGVAFRWFLGLMVLGFWAFLGFEIYIYGYVAWLVGKRFGISGFWFAGSGLRV